MSHPLEVKDLTVDYRLSSGTKRTIDRVSLEVPVGEILGVVGQSGAGKSILVRAAMNLVPAPGRISGGSVSMFGEDILSMHDSTLRQLRGARVGVIVQNARAHLNPLVRIGDQIANVYRAHRKTSRAEARAKVVDMLRNVGMPAAEERYSAYPHELSGGMAQRAMIAIAMICSPELLIADEPTNGLDVTIQDQILRLFRHTVTDRGAAGLLVSRDMGIVANYCDRVAVMQDGRIVEVADVPEFFTTATHAHSKALIASASYQSAPAVAVSASKRVMV